jgi:hypothetical protein
VAKTTELVPLKRPPRRDNATTDAPPMQYHSVSDIKEMARAVAQSRLFGLDESQAITLMLLAQAKGIHPIQAVERYHVIQGRPAMKADAMLADFFASGGTVDWGQHDHQKCEGTFTAPGVKSPVPIAWTIEDAKKADLLKNPMWAKYTRQMLRARVISEGIRMTMPGIIAGIYTPEEVADFEPDDRRPATVIEKADGTRVSVEARPARPQNNSGHASGQYASPEQIDAYRVAILDFCRDRNARWADEWADERGELPEGIKEIVHPHQLTWHLMKWSIRTRRLADVGLTVDPETNKLVERCSIEQAKKYVAIVFAREPEAVAAEAEEYFRMQADEARLEWREKHRDEPGTDAADGGGEGEVAGDDAREE